MKIKIKYSPCFMISECVAVGALLCHAAYGPLGFPILSLSVIAVVVFLIAGFVDGHLRWRRHEKIRYAFEQVEQAVNQCLKDRVLPGVLNSGDRSSDE